MLRNYGLSLGFLAIFLLALVAQAITGHAMYNNDEVTHAQLLNQQPETLTLGRYVVSSSFGQAVMENWQSEYLQFTLYIVGTVWLLQRGSPESKPLDKGGRESDSDQLVGEYARPDSPLWAKVGGLRTRIYENSLLLVMGSIWLGTWFAQSVTGWSTYNADQIEHEAERVSWLGYIGTAEFWQDTLQNWQSEFLAIGSMAVLSIYLRQRGSPESKPVGAAHTATGVEG
jgi:Domain of unknown function (DUF6766)